jgi:DNA (cytosine-5)-methyltransferase 1
MISTIEHVSSHSTVADYVANGKPNYPESQYAKTRLVDLCCGMGGLSLAGRELGMRVVAGVDLNSSALRTFSRNFPEAQAINGSIRSQKVLHRCREVLKSEYESSLIVSGPPCQGFSAAGTRDPKDRRNKILVAVSHLIVQLQPDCALIENVSRVLSQDHRNRLDRFENILLHGNYHVTNLLLDAAEFGVPQKRKRAFFFITRRPLNKDDIILRLAKYKTPPIRVEDALLGLPTPLVRPDHYDDEEINITVPNHYAMRHSQRVIEKIAAIPPGTGPMSYRKLHPTRQSNTLFSGHRAPPAHFREPRSITVREAARLQGFPDSFRIYGSFGNQMEQVTNAVPPPLSQAVLRVLFEFAKQEHL